MQGPPLHYERPLPLQVFLAHVVPLGFGAVGGYVLGVAEPLYIALSVIATIGGLMAGFEHRGALDAASRGLAGGLLFGIGVLGVHRLTGAPPTVQLPDPEVLLIAVTAVAGALLAIPGGALRKRRHRKRSAQRAADEAVAPSTVAVAAPPPAVPVEPEAPALPVEPDVPALPALPLPLPAPSPAEPSRDVEPARVGEDEAALLRGELSPAQSEVAKHRERAESLESQLLARADDLAARATEMASRASAFESRAVEAERRAAELEGSAAQDAGLQAQVEAKLKAWHDALSRRVESVAASASILESRADAGERRAERIEANAARAAREHEALQARAQQAEDTIHNEMASLESERDRARAEAEREEATIARLEAELRATAADRAAPTPPAPPPRSGRPGRRPRRRRAAQPPKLPEWRTRLDSDPALDELKRQERMANAAVREAARELWRPEEGESDGRLEDLRRQLAEAEAERERAKAAVAHRGAAILQARRAGPRQPPQA